MPQILREIFDPERFVTFVSGGDFFLIGYCVKIETL